MKKNCKINWIHVFAMEKMNDECCCPWRIFNCSDVTAIINDAWQESNSVQTHRLSMVISWNACHYVSPSTPVPVPVPVIINVDTARSTHFLIYKHLNSSRFIWLLSAELMIIEQKKPLPCDLILQTCFFFIACQIKCK